MKNRNQYSIVMLLAGLLASLAGCNGDAELESEVGPIEATAELTPASAPNVLLRIDISADEHLPRWQCLVVSKLGVNFRLEPVDCSAPSGEVYSAHHIHPDQYIAHSICTPPQPCDNFKFDVNVSGSGHSDSAHELVMTILARNDAGLPIEILIESASHPEDTAHSGDGSHGGGAHANY